MALAIAQAVIQETGEKNRSALRFGTCSGLYLQGCTSDGVVKEVVEALASTVSRGGDCGV